jgi:hypothetical protein
MIKARSGRVRCGPFDIRDAVTMPVICPTCQTLSKIERTGFGRSKPILQTCAEETKAAAAVFTRGPYNSCDDVDMGLICPTRQPRHR